MPRTQTARGGNSYQVAVWVDEPRQTVIAAAAIDDLVKGAAGQAVQNANLIAGIRRDGRPARGGPVAVTPLPRPEAAALPPATGGGAGVCHPRGLPPG